MDTAHNTSNDITLPATDAKKRLLVVDGHSWMHRAFHAISNPLIAPDGTPTNAVFGFFSMLNKAVELIRPDAVVVAFDAGKPAFRTEALQQYKIQRPPQKPELECQFPVAKELLESMRVPIACVPGWEGDDLLGTLATRGEAAGYHVFLASGDRDTYQLVDDNVSIVSSGRGQTAPVVITPPDVLARYGVTPAQVIDYLGLKGDTSDNIPGVPGVGEKTAAKLLAEYGTMDAVLAAAAAGDIPGRIGVNLVEHADLARVSRTVATIRRDVDYELDVGAVTFGDYAAGDISPTFMKYALKSPLGWMLKFAHKRAGGVSGPADDHTPTAPAGDVVRTQAGEPQPDDIAAAPVPSQARKQFAGVLIAPGGDTLFDSTELLVTDGGTACEATADKVADVLRQWATTTDRPDASPPVPLASADLKALIRVASPADTTRAAALDPAELDTDALFDIGVADYLLASNRNDHSLSTLALEYLSVDISNPDDNPDREAANAADAANAAAGTPTPTDARAAVPDTADAAPDAPAPAALTRAARVVAELASVLEQRLTTDGSLDLFRTIEMPLIPVLAQMERTGITVLPDKLAELADYGRAQIDELRAQIFRLAGADDFNPDSPKQLAEVLFDRLGLPVIRKTRTGRSTDAATLAELAPQHPIAATIVSYREFVKLQNTYLEALPRLIAADGRIHTSFNQTVAATGRLSSSNPNLQNIPVRTDLGRRIREAFVPGDADWQILSADYSQIELRVLAELSGDAGLIDAFNSGRDFHATTAARLFGVSPDVVDARMRSRAKAVNFGIVYGQGPHGLAASLEIPFAEAKAMIDRYFNEFSQVKTYLDDTVRAAHEQGWVATYYGRKRHIPELASANHNLRAFGERTAMNHPMQGTAADLIKLAMLAVDRAIRAAGLQARMLLQVHDELVFEAPAGECERLGAVVSAAMSGVADFRVPLLVTVATGPTWADAK
ncbi:MAG: DNA polymerase I [Actinomycetes bacterium]|jgi:DNA polymerase-1|nr:DNA polymerase I [Actinomycetes bacterium]